MEQTSAVGVECSVPDLYQDYLTGAPAARPFFAGQAFEMDGLLRAAETTAAFPRDRKALADALSSQQEGRGASRAALRAASLLQPDTVAVVTGQQPGLFGGPLLGLYKALTAVKLAQDLEARRGRPVVPIFWVASDDHDFEEIRGTALLDTTGALRSFRYAPHDEPVDRPSAHIVLDETILPLLQELEAALPAGPNRDASLALLLRCYAPGASLAGAFARLLSALLPELVVLDPADAVLKQLMAPVIARELRDGSPSTRAAETAGAALAAAGYREQVQVRPGFLNLFMLQDGARHALAVSNGVVEVRGQDRRFSLAEAERLLAEDAAAWSPNALLRPLVQDLLLPTAAYVGGPAEIAYHAQIGPAYAEFGIPRPVLAPRASLTLIEPAQARALETEGLSLEALREDPERILARWALESNPQVEAALTRAREGLEREMAAVTEALAAVDPTLKAAAEGAAGRALHQIESLQEKAARALKKRDQVRAERLHRTRDALYPAGMPQERHLGLVGFLGRHGTPLIDELRAKLDVWAHEPQVLNL